MRSPLAILLAASLALVAVARAQEKGDKDKKDKKEEKKRTKLPLNPFAKTKVGDWAVWTGTVKGTGVPNDAKLAMFRTVDKAEADKVTTTYTETMNGEAIGKPQAQVFELKTLTLESYLKPGEEGAKSDPLEDVKIEDEKRQVGTRTFASKRVTAKKKEAGGEVTLVLWLCEEVKAGGLVAMELHLKADKGDMTLSTEIAGFGPKGKADWGKTIEEVTKANEKKKESDPPKKDADPPKKEADPPKK